MADPNPKTESSKNPNRTTGRYSLKQPGKKQKKARISLAKMRTILSQWMADGEFSALVCFDQVLQARAKYLEMTVAGIPGCKIPLLPLAQCLEKLAKEKNEENFLASVLEDNTLPRVIEECVGSKNIANLRTLLIEYPAYQALGNKLQPEVIEGCPIGLFWLCMDDCRWAKQSNSLWRMLLQKAILALQQHWPLSRLAKIAGLSESQLKKLEEEKEAVFGNPLFYQWIQQAIRDDVQQIFEALYTAKLQFLNSAHTIFLPTAPIPSEIINHFSDQQVQLCRDQVSWKLEAEWYACLYTQQNLGAEEQGLAQACVQILDSFAPYENPILLLYVLLHRCSTQPGSSLA